MPKYNFSGPAPSITFRAFVPNKLVRTGIIRDAWKRNGHVWGRFLEGKSLRPYLWRKLEEEIGEILAAPSSKERMEEVADTLEVVSLCAGAFEALLVPWLHLQTVVDRLNKENPLPLGNPLINHRYCYQRAVELFERMKHDGDPPPAHFGKLVGLLLQGLHEDLHRERNIHELPQAFLAKRQAKGPLEGWHLEAIALPADDEMCAGFAARGLEIRPEILDVRHALPPSVLAA